MCAGLLCKKNARLKRKVFFRVSVGFSLMEVAIVLCIAAGIAGTLVPSFVKGVHIEAARKTAIEMALLKEAAQGYFLSKGAWPDDMEMLRSSGYIDERWKAENPFGMPYVVARGKDAWLLSTEVPQAMGTVVRAALPMSVDTQGKISIRVTASMEKKGVPAGTLAAWPVEKLPDGWVVCDGRALERGEYAVLFSVIGGQYGTGDGTTTFNVPDLRGRVVVGADNMGGSAADVIGGSWAQTLGAKYGEEGHVLTIAEMPAHQHEDAWNVSYDSGALGGSYSHRGDADNAHNPIRTTFTGGGLEHNNIQPSMVLCWMIKT